jgi:hypothetical protein
MRRAIGNIVSNTKVVLVTGASSGLGCAIAKALAAKGQHVFGTARVLRAGASDGFTVSPWMSRKMSPWLPASPRSSGAPDESMP